MMIISIHARKTKTDVMRTEKLLCYSNTPAVLTLMRVGLQLL